MKREPSRDYLCFYCEVKRILYIGIPKQEFKSMEKPLYYLPFPLNQLSKFLPENSTVREIAITTEKNLKALVAIREETLEAEQFAIKKVLNKFFGSKDKTVPNNLIDLKGRK